MKAYLYFSTPDVLDNMPHNEDEEDEFQKVVKKFVRYGKHVTIELDTVTQTARVMEVNE